MTHLIINKLCSRFVWNPKKNIFILFTAWFFQKIWVRIWYKLLRFYISKWIPYVEILWKLAQITPTVFSFQVSNFLCLNKCRKVHQLVSCNIMVILDIPNCITISLNIYTSFTKLKHSTVLHKNNVTIELIVTKLKNRNLRLKYYNINKFNWRNFKQEFNNKKLIYSLTLKH